MRELIEARGLKKSFGTTEAIRGIDLSVRSGEIFGLLGANGAGKSTTVECLVGVKRPDEGHVAINGKDPLENRKELFEHVGVQFQEARYQDKIKVEELCRVTASLYKHPANYRTLLADFGLLDRSKNYIEDLSGGQKQRLFIILALIPDPQLVFLDELTTGLDVRTRREVWGYLKMMRAKGVTVFLTSHFMDEVEELCDRVSIMRKGSIVFTGTPLEAVESGSYANFEEAYLAYAEEDYHACI